MRSAPQPAWPIVELAPGVSAVAPGVLWLHAARAVVAADAHLAYEEVIGGALPLWSTPEVIDTLLTAVRQLGAREILLLGDVIHGSRMSEGAARAVQRGLETLRAAAELTLVAGNHEGRSRGAAVLGPAVEYAERDGWMLLHGDRAPASARCIIGHLHPSLALGGRESAPVFLACRTAIVVPALTPYSSGLNVLGGACMDALRPFGVASRRDVSVIAVAGDRLYPFGALSELRRALKWLRPDG